MDLALNNLQRSIYHKTLQTKASIQPIDKTLSGVTTPGQSGSGGNDNEGLLDLSRSSKTEASIFDGSVSLSKTLVECVGGLTTLQRWSGYILQL